MIQACQTSDMPEWNHSGFHGGLVVCFPIAAYCRRLRTSENRWFTKAVIQPLSRPGPAKIELFFIEPNHGQGGRLEKGEGGGTGDSQTGKLRAATSEAHSNVLLQACLNTYAA